MKLFKNTNNGSKLVKSLTLIAGGVGVIAMITNMFLEGAKHDEVKEAARETAREEVKKALADQTKEGA